MTFQYVLHKTQELSRYARTLCNRAVARGILNFERWELSKNRNQFKEFHQLINGKLPIQNKLNLGISISRD